MKRHIHKVTSKGRVYHYVRVNRVILGRIKAAEGTEEYDRQYWQILQGKTVEHSRSVKTLVKMYVESDLWKRLAARTQRNYRPVIEYIKERAGDKDATRIQTKHIYQAMDANRHRVALANRIPLVFSNLFKVAIRHGWMEHNPANAVEAIRMPKEKRAPHVPWPEWAVEKFRAEASPRARLAFELGVGTVQRPADLTRFRWSDYDGDALRVVQQKTGAALWLPCTARLKATLDATPRTSLTILSLLDGRPMSYDRLAETMLKERRRLGVEAFDLHALRYTGVQELARAGCTDDEIASYSGHVSAAMIRKYAGAARQMMRATQARDKRK